MSRVREPLQGAEPVDPGTNGHSPDERNISVGFDARPGIVFRGFLFPDRSKKEIHRRKLKMSGRKNGFGTKKIAIVGMMCAIAFVAKLVSSVFPMVSGFLSFDLKDVVIVIAGFIEGPVTAAVITVIVSFIEMITISSTGLIGFVMNVLQSCAFACTAAAFYRRNRSMKGAVTGLVCGVLLTTAVMILWNWLITPLYMGVPREVVVKMLIPTFLPFNLVKGGINATLSMLLYKPVVTALRRAKLVEPSSSQGGGKKLGVAVVSALLFISFVLCALVLAKVI